MTARSKIPGAVRLLEDALEERVDVFLGYCGRSKPIAQKVKRFLESLKAKVLDWEMDFIPGRTILEQIEAAAKRSVGGIFLFTKDDDLSDGTLRPATSLASRAKRNVLIVRETNSKMPADLGGDIYASLPDRGDKPAEEVSIEPIERTLKAFVEAI